MLKSLKLTSLPMETPTLSEWTTSKLYFLGDNGEKLSIYFELAAQNLWGVNGVSPFSTVEYEQSQNDIEGFQICYPLTSLSTVEKPTPAEIATRHTLNMMWETTVDALKPFCEKSKKECKVISPNYSAYMTCKEDGSCTNDEITYEDWKYAVKPIYNHSMRTKDGKKFIDPSKPLCAYIKLATNGKGKHIKCHVMK